MLRGAPAPGAGGKVSGTGLRLAYTRLFQTELVFMALLIQNGDIVRRIDPVTSTAVSIPISASTIKISSTVNAATRCGNPPVFSPVNVRPAAGTLPIADGFLVDGLQ